MTPDDSTSPDTPAESGSSEAELIAIRREKLAKLRELGVDPFGARFETDTSPAELRDDFSDERPVRIAGRLFTIRDMGKSIFFVIGDVHGRIQGYLNKKGVSQQDWEVWHLLDRGDWIGIEGTTFTTGKGEPTVKVESLQVLSLIHI